MAGDSAAVERSAFLEHTMAAEEPSTSDYIAVVVRTVATVNTVVVVAAAMV